MSEIADVDPREHDLLSSLFHHLPCLSGQIGNGTVTATASGERYGTERTEIITAVLHLEKITGPVVGRHGRDKRLDTVCFGGNDLTFILFFQIIEIFHHIKFLLRPQDKVHPVNSSNIFRLQLCITSGYHDKGGRILLNHFPDCLTPFLVGQFRHRTGIYYANIGLLPSSDTCNTCLQ